MLAVNRMAIFISSRSQYDLIVTISRKIERTCFFYLRVFFIVRHVWRNCLDLRRERNKLKNWRIFAKRYFVCLFVCGCLGMWVAGERCDHRRLCGKFYKWGYSNFVWKFWVLSENPVFRIKVLIFSEVDPFSYEIFNFTWEKLLWKWQISFYFFQIICGFF